MAQQDMVEKLLEDYPDVFADIFNVLLFKKELINPKDLSDTKLKSQYKANDAKLHEMERDITKIWNKEVTLALVGIENQTLVDKFMPLRVLAYDGASYRSQLIVAEEEKVKEIYPVITIVLYLGKTAWNQPKSLKETIKKYTKIPKELDEYVNDYNIYVFDIPRLSREEVELFKSDFRIVADFFV